MDKKFQEYKGLDLSQVNKDVLKEWESNNTFEQSLKNREGYPSFVFFEGPPSANGMPGIHHVMARTIKDIICRYKTLQGFLVERKAERLDQMQFRVGRNAEPADRAGVLRNLRLDQNNVEHTFASFTN